MLKLSLRIAVSVAIAACCTAWSHAAVRELPASAATVHGAQARFMVIQGIGNICFWTDASDWLSWETSIPAAGEYVLELRYSCQAGSEGSTFEVGIGDAKVNGKIAQHTGDWYTHTNIKLGTVTLSAGRTTVTFKPTSKPGQAVMNLVWLRLIPAAEYPAYAQQAEREKAALAAHETCPIYIVPNFHPASCGWLTDFSTERNYCAYSYLAHLDRVRDDPNYAFALSEVNNQMAIMAFEPQRISELKQRIRQGRVELVNAFFLEPTINLSGGEALVKMGVEGLRWQEQVMGVRPRLYWGIDLTGVHEQMGQIISGLGLDGMVYCRDNPTPKTLHWLESPDGSRCLALSPGGYAEWDAVFSTHDRLGQADLRALLADAQGKTRRTPVGAPVLVLGGAGDYSLPPARKEYPSEFLEQWKQIAPDRELHFTTASKYLDAILPGIRSNETDLPTSRSGARLTWTSFWIQNPEVKGRYRHAEHALQSAEALATIAAAKPGVPYPVQPLYHGWLQMLLNMDRNTLWGAAGGMVFEDARSWDVRDRFDWVEATSRKTQDNSIRAALGRGRALGLYNPANWERHDPVALRLPTGSRPAGLTCQLDSDGLTLYRADLPPCSLTGVPLETSPPPAPRTVALPPTIETNYYSARVDPHSGALCSLKLKPSGREMLGGPVLVVAEAGGDFHSTPPRPQRKRLGDSGQLKPTITVTQGPVATVVEARTTFFAGGQFRQRIHFYSDSPRIDFDTEVNDIPQRTVVVAEFPLARDIAETRRGIPYGFSHGAWARPNPDLSGYADGIQAAIRWSDYQLVDGGGIALLDRGLPGRELTGRTPVLFLLNAQDTYMGYPCPWLSGKGAHRASYALVAHDNEWQDARVARMAWEFNAPPVAADGVAAAAPKSYLRTSDNVIVEALRREGADIEVRLVECLGLPGTVRLILNLPHVSAAITDLTGAHPQPLPGGPRYEFPIRAQQIVTLRFRTDQPVPAIQPLLKWDELVPPSKLAALRRRLPGRIGHPPEGSGLPAEAQPVLPDDAVRSFTLGRPVKGSNVYHSAADCVPELAVDGDPGTRWATDDNVSQATLEVDLGKPQLIGRAYLSEAYDRVRQFELQMLRAGKWVTFARGGRIGANLNMKFIPVTAQVVRLNIPDAPGGPTIWEFMLLPPR